MADTERVMVEKVESGDSGHAWWRITVCDYEYQGPLPSAANLPQRVRDGLREWLDRAEGATRG